MFDFSTNSWTHLKDASNTRYSVGIHFDETNECVYIEGGKGEESINELYQSQEFLIWFNERRKMVVL